MLNFISLCQKTNNLIQKSLKSVTYVRIYAQNRIFLLEMVAILENGSHFEFLRGERVFTKLNDMTNIHAKFHACITKNMIFALICSAKISCNRDVNVKL